MRFGIDLVNFGAFRDPRAVMKVARVAEEAGWDGLFLWDHLSFAWGPSSGDPWISLSAAATCTERLLLGTTITPVARRRPHVLAQTLATLDLLAPGRVLLGAGLGGVEREFTAFGEEAGARLRAAKLDEGLEAISALLSGGPVTRRGEHVTVDGVTLVDEADAPRSRIPIWIGGESPAALRRAARWDGWVATGTALDGSVRMTIGPQEFAEKLGALREARDPTLPPAEAALLAYSEPGEVTLVRSYEAAGVDWWLEVIQERRGSVDQLLERVGAGPTTD